MIKLFARDTASEQKSSFRADIAGLRGLAVILVLLCHFEIPGFGGGFIGPDIFFVISGYLITGLLVKEYARSIAARSRSRVDSTEAVKKSSKARRGKISFTDFYLRRARRIFPAAFFVLICVNVYAVLNLNILQSSQIKSDSVWTLLFMANINFLRQATDYFAQNNTASPLQHYWTLSVEEQFYFVWPILFLFATRLFGLKIFGNKVRWAARVRLAILGLTIVSFIWLLVEFSTDPTAAYFSTFSRAWELGFGGVLSLISADAFKARLGSKLVLMRTIAVTFIVGSIAIVTPNNFGFTLIIPVVATGFVLLTGSVTETDLAHRVLANRPFIAIGAISYSLYLWHWPIFVFGQDLGLMDTLIQRFLGIVLSFILGILSYRYIELTFMRIPLPEKKKLTLKKSGKSATLPAIATASVVSVLWLFTYSGISFGGSSEPTTPWVPSVSETALAQGGSDQGNGTAQNAEYVRQAAAVISSGQQLATADQLPKMISQMASIHDDAGGWVCAQPINRLFYCTLGSPSAKRLWVGAGDSHMEMWKSALSSIWRGQTDLRIELYTVVHCANSLDKAGIAFGGSVEDKAACMPMHNVFLNRIAKAKPELVILSDNTVPNNLVSAYGDGLSKMIAKVKANTSHVLLFGQTPEYPMLDRCLNKQLSNVNACGGTLTSVNQRRQIQQQTVTQTGVALFDPDDYLCLDNFCPPVLNGKLVSKDGSHLDPKVAADLSSHIKNQIDLGLNASPAAVATNSGGK